MATIRRNHKPNLTICKCSRCGEISTAPERHPHRKCSGYNVNLGILFKATSGDARGVWQGIDPVTAARLLAQRAVEHTRGPTESELADAEVARELANPLAA